MVMSLIFWIEGCKNKQEATQPVVKQEEPKADSTQSNKKNIVFFGNSLTAGYGLEQAEAFPALIQAKIDSLKLPYKVINAGLSGETTAGGNTRIDWLLNQPMDIFILELGGNDGLRGLSLPQMKSNLGAIVDHSQKSGARVLLVGMKLPPNYGEDYTHAFENAFAEVAKRYHVALVPFMLEGFAEKPEYFQRARIHPTAEAQPLILDRVWPGLKPLLK